MAIKHMVLGLLVAAIWGLAFTVIRIGLDVVPPMLLTALRFAVAAFPLLFFLRPPDASWPVVVAYGILQGAVMFGLVFYAIASGMPAGLASLVVQCQVFFTVSLAVIIDKEHPKRHQLIAGGVAAIGIIIIALAKTSGQDVPVLPLFLTLLGAVAWAMANIVSRRARSSDPVSFIVWSSVAAPPCLLVVSLITEPGALAGLLALDAHDAWTLIWVTAVLALPTTVVAFAIWVWLLRSYDASMVAPFALLVPVFGFGGAAVFLGERWSAGVGVGALIVLIALAIHVLGDRRVAARKVE